MPTSADTGNAHQTPPRGHPEHEMPEVLQRCAGDPRRSAGCLRAASGTPPHTNWGIEPVRAHALPQNRMSNIFRVCWKNKICPSVMTRPKFQKFQTLAGAIFVRFLRASFRVCILGHLPPIFPSPFYAACALIATYARRRRSYLLLFVASGVDTVRRTLQR